MRAGEHVMERLEEAHTTVEDQLATHVHIHVHHGKTQVWNRGGIEPSGSEEMTRVARVLRGDHSLGQRYPICVAPPLHVWRHKGELLASGGSACVLHPVTVSWRFRIGKCEPLHTGQAGQIPSEWSHKETLGPQGS